MYRIAALCLLAATAVFMLKAPEKANQERVRSTFYAEMRKK
jgi:hypothetical protein